uniref:Uncharacterized protein n=2 Tax=Meloidogyne TaxID=189290 RepID=A0A915N704_MELJA
MSSFFKEVTDLELLYNPKSEDSLKFGVSALPGMTFANLFGLVGFLTLNFVYLYAVITE